MKASTFSVFVCFQILALCFVRKLLDYAFTQSDLYWLDHILPDAERRKKEDREEDADMSAEEKAKVAKVRQHLYLQNLHYVVKTLYLHSRAKKTTDNKVMNCTEPDNRKKNIMASSSSSIIPNILSNPINIFECD